MTHNYIERKFQIDSDLGKKLIELLKALREDYDSPYQWKVFYEFVVMGYRVKAENRPSVSSLTSTLRKSGIPNPESLSVLYAHGLYMLSVYENIPIYEVFNP